MRDKQLEPNAITFSALIRALARAQQWQRGLGLLQEADAKGVALDVALYSTAMSACESGRNWELAFGLLQEMRRRRLDPDAIAYSAAISACRWGGRWADALGLLSEMRAAGLAPGAAALGAAISALGEGGRWDWALHLLAGMRERGPAPNAAVLGAALDVDGIAYSSAIGACGACGRWAEALRVLGGMEGEGLAPGEGSYDAAAIACERAGRWAEALALLREMPGRRLAAGLIALTAAIGACGGARRWRWALRLMGEMPRRQLQPDAIAWNAVIAAAEAASQWQLAVDLLAQMPARALKPDRASYGAALLACARGNAWGRALGLVDEMKAQRVEPDTLSYGTLLTECEQHSLEGREASLLDDLGPRGAPEGDSAASSGGTGSERQPAGKGRGPGLCAAAANAAAAQRAASAGQAPESSGVPPVRPQQDFLVQAALQRIPPGSPYSKELNLLRHVLLRARRNDPRSVCQAIESYGKDVLGKSGRWLKVAGDAKAEILTSAVRAGAVGGNILEIGAYCGYSATRMAIVVPEVHLASMEVDPVHVVIARNVLDFAGLSGSADVWTGHSKDLIPRIEGRYGGPGQLHFSAVFFDQKGSLYERDLDALERQGLLWPGAIVIADNVLKPGAPLFLRKVVLDGDFKAQIVSMQEFAMPSEDWMSASVQRPARFRQQKAAPPAAELVDAEEEDESPHELVQLDREADRMRERATGPGRSVTFNEWAEFAEKMRTRMAVHGICVTSAAPQPKPMQQRR